MDDPQVGLLGVQDFKTRLDSGEPFAVLDVREDHERAYAAIPLTRGAVDLQVPLGQIPDRLDEIVAAGEGRSLVVYCNHGQRSMAAAAWLSHQGLAHVHNLEGGIDAWSKRVDPSIRRY